MDNIDGVDLNKVTVDTSDVMLIEGFVVGKTVSPESFEHACILMDVINVVTGKESRFSLVLHPDNIPIVISNLQNWNLVE